ncbi:MAG: hypothetical protein IPK26_31700 [Planctomycetes bacterium]|nr:hypothetical protein [Planctomycetota bacterium]
MPKPFSRPLSCWVLFLLAAPRAQGALENVIPGRLFERQKLLSPGLTDVWKVDVAADEMLHCVIATSAFDPILEFVDGEGRVLHTNDGEGTRSELWLRAPTSGPMAFQVKPFRGSGGGQYSFQLSRFTTQPLLQHGEATAEFGDEQWRHFRVPMHKGELLVPTVVGEGRLTAVLDADRNAVAESFGGFLAPRDGDLFVRVEGREGKRCQVLTQLARQRDWPTEAMVRETMAAGGRDVWRLRVGGGKPFELRLDQPDAELAFELVDPTPDGHGPRFTACGQLDKGGSRRQFWFARREATLELRLRNPGERSASYAAAVVREERELSIGVPAPARLAVGRGDLYRLPTRAGQLLRLSLRSDAFDARFDLWNPQGEVIARPDDAGPLDRHAEHTFLVSANGDHRVLVYTSGGVGSGDYTLAVEDVPVPELVVGTPLPIRVAANATGYLHLRLQQGQEVWLSVRSRAFDASLWVLDPAGDGGFHAEGGGVDGDVLVAYRSSHAGVHTLMVPARRDGGEAVVSVLQP